MFSQFKKYLMLNILSLCGFGIFTSWVWQFIVPFFGQLSWIIHPVVILEVLAQQYTAIGWILLALLVEMFIRYLFEDSDNIINIKLPDKVLVAGLILLVLPALYWGLCFFFA